MKPTKTIKLPTYSCSIIVSVVNSVQVEAERLYRKHKITEPFGAEAEGALVMIGMEKYYLIFHSDFLSHNTIAHEIFHATVRITEDRDVADEEAQAWLAGHLTAEIYKFLEQKKLPVKHG